MAQAVVAAPHRRGFLTTLRTDAWWLEPVLVAMSVGLFFGWLTISILFNVWAFEIGPYLSPVYEPKLWDNDTFPLASPALIVLIGPVPFRASCYYYRRVFYRSYFFSPPACAVGDIGRSYKGETIFPFIVNNLHRFAMYAALVFVPILWYGAIHGFYNTHGTIDGQSVDKGWGIGLGSAILCLNAFLLMMYTFSCHSFRHFIGGGLDCFSANSTTRVRKRAWDYVTSWNHHHRLWAWSSLVGIVFTDLYIRFVANGWINDPNTWGF